MTKQYKNLEYLAFCYKIKERQWWCGYVKLPDNHPYKKLIHKESLYGIELEVGYDDMDIECHGGLTFSQEVNEINKDNCNLSFTKGSWIASFTKGSWIGWDYNHYGDTYENWTKEQIEEECKNVIDQLIKTKKQ